VTRFRNAEHALIALAGEVMENGTTLVVRGSTTREMLHQTVTLARPLERVIAVNGRRNNVFAAIAETLWMLAGRDDIEFLLPYVPRAGDFSDDGVAWRGAYGPRLRNWRGRDQVRLMAEHLRAEPESRRAVAVIYDPERDLDPSLDIPCTNWIHFLIRDGRLHMEIAVRSNDLFWGFSGINTFEWSVLHEMMAFWTQTEPGEATYYVSSLHLYSRHFRRAAIAAESNPRVSPHGTPEFATSLDELSFQLRQWFEIERGYRSGDTGLDVDAIGDPLLRDFARMIRIFWTAQHSGPKSAVPLIDAVVSRDLVDGAKDYLAWKYGLEFDEAEEERVDALSYLRELHRAKDASYGDSWKRRGEQIGVMANIARKVDRLERADSPPLDGERLIDTVADLTVYAIKYQTFILDAVAAPGRDSPWSDGIGGFEELLEKLQSAPPDMSTDVAATFSAIEGSIAQGDPVEARLDLADELARRSLTLLREVMGANRLAAFQVAFDSVTP